MKNSGVPNFFCASSLLLRITLNASEIDSTAAPFLAIEMTKEKASTTGSELKSLLDEELNARIFLMEVGIYCASCDVFER